MKKLIILLFSIVLLGCSKNSDGDKIFGYWVDYESGSDPSLELEPNNRYSLKLSDGHYGSGEFKFDKNYLTIQVGKSSIKYHVTFDGANVMKLSTDDTNGVIPGSKMKFKRR